MKLLLKPIWIHCLVIILALLLCSCATNNGRYVVVQNVTGRFKTSHGGSIQNQPPDFSLLPHFSSLLQA